MAQMYLLGWCTVGYRFKPDRMLNPMCHSFLGIVQQHQQASLPYQFNAKYECGIIIQMFACQYLLHVHLIWALQIFHWS